MITKLKDNEIFVFGSNLAGHHLGGSAKQAWQDFGAVWGTGEGLTGQCYAFPTLDENLQKRTTKELMDSVYRLVNTARENKDKTFLLTKVGCRIANYDEKYMRELFEGIEADNIVFPEGWGLEKKVDEAMDKVISEYGEVLKELGDK